ncbi:MAG: AAA family ATPase [Thermodesulfobacteriota bacterium]|nr:AAA family ATPase [Thermodesulfobacteriota bacterium]
MMDVEQKSESSTPFQEACNTSQFFTGGGRGAILSEIKAALQAKVDLVTLIGEEGSGKTMLCKMLKEQWDTQYKIVFLPQIVESFEDVVRITAQECNVQYPADSSRADAKKIFLGLVGTLREGGGALLLICDEADRMYLATFERLRKILDEANTEGGGLQILLAGRKSLAGHLEQLTLCDFEEISEKQFLLSALSDDDTWSYLNFCVQAHRGTEQQEVFTKEAASKIASMGKGNLRRINVYADESLQSSNADTSFLVLLDHVKDDDLGDELFSPSRGILQQLPFSPRYLLGGVAVLSLLLLLVLFGGDEEKYGEDIQDQTGDIEVVTPVVETEIVLHEATGVVAPESVRDKPDAVVKDTAAEEEVITEVVVDASEPEIAAEAVPDQGRDIEPVVEEEVISVSDEPQHTPVVISPVEIVEKTVDGGEEVDSGIPLLTGRSKIVIESSKHIAPIQEKILPEKVAPLAETPKDPVLAGFIVAGEKWQAGEMDDKFSIQLMALKSEQAEENLKRILSQPDYQTVLDELVMLKRPSDPPVVLVFYGAYPSMAAARNARNNMPIFLRKHHPYAISVRGAVEKARAE